MRSVRVVVAVAAVILVAGCSSMPRVASSYQTDADKVALVNATARERGLKVIWVNPPQKRVDEIGQKPQNLAGH